jgi:hypothetical protein
MGICAGEAGAEMRGDAGRAQGLQRAATGGRCYDQVGDVRGAGHDAVGALRLKEAAYTFVTFVRLFSVLWLLVVIMVSQ